MNDPGNQIHHNRNSDEIGKVAPLASRSAMIPPLKPLHRSPIWSDQKKSQLVTGPLQPPTHWFGHQQSAREILVVVFRRSPTASSQPSSPRVPPAFQHPHDWHFGQVRGFFALGKISTTRNFRHDKFHA